MVHGERGREHQARAAWQHVELPDYASELKGRVAFAWRAMDAFYEEDERIVGHAADAYHRIDIRQTSRHLVVRAGDQVVADSSRPVVLYESGFAPRWYVPRADIAGGALTPVERSDVLPVQGPRAATTTSVRGSARPGRTATPGPEVRPISGLVSFEPDKVEVSLDGVVCGTNQVSSVVSHGIDRDLTVEELSG